MKKKSQKNKRRKLIIIVGPQAVGKMTVGQLLAQRTGLKLFHNHMSIEFALQFFPYDTADAQDLIDNLRRLVFESLSKSSIIPGFIFTYVWNFDDPDDKRYIMELIAISERHGLEVIFVELWSDLHTRLARNITENRLKHKPSKRNIEWTVKDIIESTKNERLKSQKGDYPSQYKVLKVNNTYLAPNDVVNQIIEFIKRV